MKARFVVECEFDMGIWGELREAQQEVSASLAANMFVTDVRIVSATVLDADHPLDPPVSPAPSAHQTDYGHAATDVILYTH